MRASRQTSDVRKEKKDHNKYYTANSSSTDDSILRLMGPETSMNQ